MPSILENKRVDTVKFKASISPALSERLQALEARIKQEAPHTQLNTDSIVEKALESAVRKASKELDGMKSQESGHLESS